MFLFSKKYIHTSCLLPLLLFFFCSIHHHLIAPLILTADSQTNCFGSNPKKTTKTRQRKSISQYWLQLIFHIIVISIISRRDNKNDGCQKGFSWQQQPRWHTNAFKYLKIYPLWNHFNVDFVVGISLNNILWHFSFGFSIFLLLYFLYFFFLILLTLMITLFPIQ